MVRGLLALAVLLAPWAAAWADPISGSYLESRTCQVYTGPCFANAETALAGKEAVMAWNIEDGAYQGVSLKGLSVVLVCRGSDTLGFGGVNDPKELKSLVLLDSQATAEQRIALLAFVKQHAGRAGKEIIRVETQPISMSLDTAELRGKLQAGKQVTIETRKAKPTDCICTNEVAYYPPLAKLERFAAGVAIESQFKGKGLGAIWSMPESRSAYMATFSYE